MDPAVETIVTVAAPIFAIVMVFILAPVGYLAARRGDDPGALPMRTVAGFCLLAVAGLSPVTGGALLHPLFAYLAAWVGGAMVLSALPYWLVKIFRPTNALFERLDRAIEDRYTITRGGPGDHE